MNIRSAFIIIFIAFCGCGTQNIDTMNVLVRSDIITSSEKEKEILKKASLISDLDSKIKIIKVSGTPYERGYQQGVLLRDEVRDNLTYLYTKAIEKFKIPELFDEAFMRMLPFIPQRYIEEMHGLAHGSKLPLRVVQSVHMLPEIAEWSGKKKIKKLVKKMMDEDLGTSCSNIGASGDATSNGKMYTLRILDWGLHRISKAHKYPTVVVSVPENGNSFANIGWAGFLGAVSGMNDKGVTLGEMAYGNPDHEHLRGIPMTFLLREVMQFASSVKEAEKILKEGKGTNSFIFVITDGKNQDSAMFVKDTNRFIRFDPGKRIIDRNNDLPGFKNIVYGGHYQDRMVNTLSENFGKISPKVLMEKIIPEIAMPSNFQNVIYSPEDLTFWVANAGGPELPAFDEEYKKVDLNKIFRDYSDLQNK